MHYHWWSEYLEQSLVKIALDPSLIGTSIASNAWIQINNTCKWINIDKFWSLSATVQTPFDLSTFDDFYDNLSHYINIILLKHYFKKTLRLHGCWVHCGHCGWGWVGLIRWFLFIEVQWKYHNSYFWWYSKIFLEKRQYWFQCKDLNVEPPTNKSALEILLKTAI